MRTHESQSQQEPVANEDLDIDNIINANIRGSGARHGNDLSRRNRLGGEDRSFQHPLLFRSISVSGNLRGILVLHVSSQYTWIS